jgi:RNA polymerase sigma-70 factor (ECF subfamily)
MVDADFSLIQATAQGDHHAFEDLIKRYQTPVLNFIYRYLGDRCAAEDLTQEVFLRVYQAAPRFDPRARVSSWIFRIAYNLSINELRRRSRLSKFAVNASLEGIEYSDESCSEGLKRDETLEEITTVLDQLPEKQRAALLLKVNEGLSYREIGEVLETSVASVESLIFRARKNLKQLLAKPKQSKE